MTFEVILHLDIDAFFAAVEQVLDHRLAGRPVIVGSGVVASCSYESRVFGVRTGMPLREARRLCPAGVYLAGDYGNYALFANRVEGICRDFTPVVEQSSLDDFYLDLTGCPARDRVSRTPAATAAEAMTDALALAEIMRAQIQRETELSCSMGVGRSKLFARLASAKGKPGGLVPLWPEAERGWLAELPIDQLPGAGRKVCSELSGYGIQTVGELAALPQEVLVRLFGVAGRTLWQRARGIDPRRVRVAAAQPDTAVGPRPHSISRETTLEQPGGDVTFLGGMLTYLVQRATWELRRQHLEARCLSVKLCYGDFQTRSASSRLDAASAEDSHFTAAARDLLRRIYTRRLPVRHLGIELSKLTASRGGQMLLFDERRRSSQRRLRGAIDAARGRFGFQAVVEGNATELVGKLAQDCRGFRLRTPSLSR